MTRRLMAKTAIGLAGCALAAACGPPRAPTALAPSAPAPSAPAPPAPEPPRTPEPSPSEPPSVPAETQAAPACPDDMVHVTHEYCADLQRTCKKSEYDRPNRITICHEFSETPGECRGERRSLDYCIDRYEFPNEKGGHPPVMVDFHAAQRSCEERGKRLCLESEWVAACEGPNELPFPYGYQRSSESCNIDNPWIEPNLGRVYAKRDDIRDAELKRLDQSVPSGFKEACVSGFGVYDLTGNFDEWVRLDEPDEKATSKYAGLKGGAWGHVRNACRPVTTSHAPEFTYYFISFRCCKDSAVESAD